MKYKYKVKLPSIGGFSSSLIESMTNRYIPVVSIPHIFPLIPDNLDMGNNYLLI